MNNNPFKRGDEVRIRNLQLDATKHAWCGINSEMLKIASEGKYHKVTYIEDSQIVRLSCDFLFHINDLHSKSSHCPYKNITEKDPEIFNIEKLVIA